MFFKVSYFSSLLSFVLLAVLSVAIIVHSTGATTSSSFWDSCPSDWSTYDDMCFKHFSAPSDSNNNRPNETLPTQLTFGDALSFCEVEHGATIIPIQNASMMLFLQELVGNNSGRKFWNGVYQDVRFQHGHHYSASTADGTVWRTVYNRTGFQDFFFWDQRRRMPHLTEDCIAFHVRGDLSKRIVGGNNAMISHSCYSRADVVCGRKLRSPYAVSAVNGTASGAVVAAEDVPLKLYIVGKSLPRLFGVQLQTTNYKTHNGEEGQPTHCVQTRPRARIFMNESSTPGFARNVSNLYSFHPHCNGTCNQALIEFPPPSVLNLQRGAKYSVCFFFPYDAAVPLSSDEFRWDFLPSLYIEVGIREQTYLEETCERHQQLVNLLYLDQSSTDTTRSVRNPWYFDGPVVKDEVKNKNIYS